MLDKLSQLESLYGLHRVAIHPRVLPVVVLAFLAFVNGWLFLQGYSWAFNWVWFFALLAAVMLVWRVWPGYAISSRKQQHRAKALQKQGDWPAAYQIYQKLNRSAVWSWEKSAAKLALAWFLYEVGNLKRAFALANELASQSQDLSVANRVSWMFLQTVQLEQSQEYDQALAGLNGLLETVENRD